MTCPFAAPDYEKKCIETRIASFKYHNPAIKPWNPNRCELCKLGAKRQTASYVPETEKKYIPRPQSRPLNGPPCPICGKARPTRKGITSETLCSECSKEKLKADRQVKGPKTTCKNGHNEWGVLSNGERYCIACNRERMRKIRGTKEVASHLSVSAPTIHWETR